MPRWRRGRARGPGKPPAAEGDGRPGVGVAEGDVHAGHRGAQASSQSTEMRWAAARSVRPTGAGRVAGRTCSTSSRQHPTTVPPSITWARTPGGRRAAASSGSTTALTSSRRRMVPRHSGDGLTRVRSWVLGISHSASKCKHDLANRVKEAEMLGTWVTPFAGNRRCEPRPCRSARGLASHRDARWPRAGAAPICGTFVPSSAPNRSGNVDP